MGNWCINRKKEPLLKLDPIELRKIATSGDCDLCNRKNVVVFESHLLTEEGSIFICIHCKT